MKNIIVNMIEIVSFKGEVYKYDQETGRIFKSGYLVPSDIAEPVYSDLSGEPVFSGIYLKNEDAILSRSGKINSVTDINSIY